MKKLIILLLFTTFVKAQIQEDKVKHFVAGAAVGSISYAITYHETQSKTKALIASVLMATLAGATKELYDNRKGGTGFNNADLGATALGGVTVGLTINIFNK
jgi:uncharacterized protein YfiM (DUF2279 family)